MGLATCWRSCQWNLARAQNADVPGDDPTLEQWTSSQRSEQVLANDGLRTDQQSEEAVK